MWLGSVGNAMLYFNSDMLRHIQGSCSRFLCSECNHESDVKVSLNVGQTIKSDVNNCMLLLAKIWSTLCRMDPGVRDLGLKPRPVKKLAVIGRA